MCHPGAVPATWPPVSRQEVRVPLSTGEQLPALRCLPESGRGPTVVLVSDIYGRTPFYQQLAALLAADGCVSLLPDIFFRQGELPEETREAAFERRGRLDEPGALRDLEDALAWLENRPEVRATGPVRHGLLGFCLGGTLALDLCARRADLAAVCYYAFPSGLGGPNAAPRPFDLVEGIQGPILAMWGDEDYIDTEEIRRFGAAMRASPADYRYVVYPGVGHGFLRGLVDGGPAGKAATDSWERTRAFFAAHLAGGAG